MLTLPDRSAVGEHAFAVSDEERRARERERNLAAGRRTQARQRARARQRAQRERITGLRAQRREIKAKLPAAERAYERALDHPRLRGLEETGDRLLGMVHALKRVEAELRELGG